MFKQLLSLLVLFSFFIIGFLHNSMMAFAMQKGIHKEIMQKMGCNISKGKKCSEKCHKFDIKIKNVTSSNINFSKKIFKLKIFQILNINKVGSFLDNKNLIKKTYPPNYKNKIKNYSYSDLTKIIKSTI